MNNQEPLFAFQWNELRPPAEVEAALLSIVARDLSGTMRAIGTGFVLKANEHRALASSAAHVFTEVRRIQDRDRDRSHSSALPEFKPPPKAVDLTSRGLVTIAAAAQRPHIGVISGLALNEATDVAMMQLNSQVGSDEPIYEKEFLLDDRLPSVGGLVAVMSYADFSCVDEGSGRFTVSRRPVMRVGSVLEVFPDGQRLCRGPCIVTTIPVFSGMSGGPAMFYDSVGAMRVFGFVCSDPDKDGPQKQDRSIAGRSLIAKLPCASVTLGSDGLNDVHLTFRADSVAGQLDQAEWSA